MIEHKSGAVEWHHKDGTRCYWSVRAWPTPDPASDEGRWGDVIWHYDIRVSGGGLEWDDIHSGRIEVISGKHLPDPEDIIADYQAHVAQVMIGFAKSHVEQYGPGLDPGA